MFDTKSEGSLPRSHEPDNGPRPESSIQYSSIFLISTLILSSHLLLGLPRTFVPSGFPIKNCMSCAVTMRATCTTNLSLFHSSMLIVFVCVCVCVSRSTNHYGPQYAVSFTSLLLPTAFVLNASQKFLIYFLERSQNYEKRRLASSCLSVRLAVRVK